MTTRTTVSFLLVLLCIAAPLAAQNAAPVEQRLREQIKSMAAQLRTAETEKATLLAEKTVLDEQVRKLTADFEKLGKQSADAQDAAKKDIEKLRADLAGRETEMARTREELAKAVSFGTQSAQLATKYGDERNKLSVENVQLKRTVADQRVKNGKMFDISNEILTRYEKFGLGTALTAREPFVGITRARLETMVEEYGGKIAEQRLKAVGNTPGGGKPGPTETKRPKD
jgi:septal ring factor EnvC (AmiA/AmiB activator)